MTFSYHRLMVQKMIEAMMISHLVIQAKLQAVKLTADHSGIHTKRNMLAIVQAEDRRRKLDQTQIFVKRFSNSLSFSPLENSKKLLCTDLPLSDLQLNEIIDMYGNRPNDQFRKNTLKKACGILSSHPKRVCFLFLSYV